MSRQLIALALAFGIGAPALAASAAAKDVDANVEVEAGEAGIDLSVYEQVDSITALTPLHGFSVVDRDTLIVWRTAFDPYIVKLRFASPDLRFARAVGFSQATGRIYARFDRVQIDGLRYPIDRIYKLEREQAKELLRRG